jgi:NADH-quinone oxidoreductase subunit M
MSSIAVPMTNGFIGEFLILLGSYQYSPWVAVFSVTGVVLGAAYMLWMVKRVFFGPKGEIVLAAEKDSHHALYDLSPREVLVLVPLVVLIFWMGLFPNQFMNYSKTSVDYLIQNKNQYMLLGAGER